MFDEKKRSENLIDDVDSTQNLIKKNKSDSVTRSYLSFMDPEDQGRINSQVLKGNRRITVHKSINEKLSIIDNLRKSKQSKQLQRSTSLSTSKLSNTTHDSIDDINDDEEYSKQLAMNQ